jgi:hypothetical protein
MAQIGAVVFTVTHFTPVVTFPTASVTVTLTSKDPVVLKVAS